MSFFHLQVPESFRTTVQSTLREFFKSIQAEKDQEQSWKKAIYKIIARLDDAVPEYFKSPNWMEQLAESTASSSSLGGNCLVGGSSSAGVDMKPYSLNHHGP
jgi:Homeo-prospero domain